MGASHPIMFYPPTWRGQAGQRPGWHSRRQKWPQWGRARPQVAPQVWAASHKLGAGSASFPQWHLYRLGTYPCTAIRSSNNNLHLKQEKPERGTKRLVPRRKTVQNIQPRSKVVLLFQFCKLEIRLLKVKAVEIKKATCLDFNLLMETGGGGRGCSSVTNG